MPVKLNKEIYADLNGYLTNGYGNIVNFKAKLVRIGECDKETYDSIMVVYKLQRLRTQHCGDNILKCIDANDTFIIKVDTRYNMWNIHLDYNEPYDNRKFFKYYIYKSTERNFQNPNREIIAKKTAEAKARNRKLVKDIDFVLQKSNTAITVSYDFILNLINEKLNEKGYDISKEKLNIYIE